MKVLVIASILFATTTISEKPQWSNELGAVRCHNALSERHYVLNNECGTTICTFETDVVYVFQTCGNNTSCVAYGEKECTEERIVL